MSPSGMIVNKPQVYAKVGSLDINQWTLSGNWTVEKESASLNAANGGITFRFHARDLHLVLGPGADSKLVRFRALIDGKAPGAAHGVDIDAEGNGTIVGQRLYQLVRQDEPIGDQTFQIEFLDPGAQAFAFTFG